MGSERFNKMAKQYKNEVEGNPTPTTQPIEPQGASALGNTPAQAEVMRKIQSGEIDFSQPRPPLPPSAPPPNLQQQIMDNETMSTFEKDPVKKMQLLKEGQRLRQQPPPGFDNVKKMLGQ